MILEIPSELETRLRPLADAHGQTLEAFALTQLEQSARATATAPQLDRRARLAALRGNVTGKGPTVDEFLAERQAEAEELNGPAKSETHDERRDRVSAAIDEAQKHFAPLLHGGDAVSQMMAEKRADVQREVERGL